ncbi:hypothetical protein [Nevskia soli]|uniref:hypothetical protein n=1 Tax=Nevskia soli TaxID=418856 RepID=UPI0004A70067|nr:hypothetical protein [Nevskia soli]
MAAAGRLELLVSPGVKKGIDYVAYAVSGVALVAGATFGVQRLMRPKPAAPQVAAAAPAIPPPVDATEAPPTDADQATSPDAQQAMNSPQPSAEELNLAARRAEEQAAAEQAAFARDQATYYALQKNCYEAANNNQNGEYPELQATACNRYAQFAHARNWDTGTLPAYGQAAPQQPAQAPADTTAEVQPEVAAPAPQVIILEQNYGRYRPGSGYGNGYGYHRNEQSGHNNAQGQHQIGPNYPLPHPQQPPPVSQAQHNPAHNQMAPVAGPQR